MPNWRRQFKILTHVPLLGRYHSIPEFVIVSWCKKRKRFRIKERLAVGMAFRRPDEFGKQLAEQHNLPFEIVNIERAITLTMALIRSQLEMPTTNPTDL